MMHYCQCKYYDNHVQRQTEYTVHHVTTERARYCFFIEDILCPLHPDVKAPPQGMCDAMRHDFRSPLHDLLICVSGENLF
jgi:hypothetical protein